MTSENIHQCIAFAARLQEIPEDGAKIAARDSQILFGETFKIFEERGGWAYGRLETDGYEAWVETRHLKPYQHKPTHYVSALRTHIYPKPHFTAFPELGLPMTARLMLGREDDSGKFLEAPGLGWAVRTHFCRADEAHALDPAGVAELFLGTPYLFGGRSHLGIDCSGLVQIACLTQGIRCRKDTDQQDPDDGFAKRLSPDTELQRNDIVYFMAAGHRHVGIMRDQKTMLHATAHGMITRAEPLEDFLDRYHALSGEGIHAVRRL